MFEPTKYVSGPGYIGIIIQYILITLKQSIICGQSLSYFGMRNVSLGTSDRVFEILTMPVFGHTDGGS